MVRIGIIGVGFMGMIREREEFPSPFDVFPAANLKICPRW